MSFKYKTVLGVALIEALMLALLVMNSLAILTSSNERELIKRANTITELFAASNMDAVLSNDLATLESFVIGVLKKPGIIYVRVLGREGVILAEGGDRASLNRVFKPDYNYKDVTDGVFDTYASINAAGIEYGKVEIGFSIKDINNIVKEARDKSLFFAGGELVLSAVFSLILGVYLTRAVNHLRKGAQNISEGNLGYQIDVNGSDELASAARSFNEMSLKLKNLDTARTNAERELMDLNNELEKRVEERAAALAEAYEQLKIAQSQMLQREKMASVGQLAAGVAHEINNPIGFVSSNLHSLGKYISKMKDFIGVQAEALKSAAEEDLEHINKQKKKLKLDYILNDAEELVEESLDGAERVRVIVQNLKSFSRVDEAEVKMADINDCMESTLNIVWNELKYNAEIEKDYGNIPLTKCHPQQLNQVFMNILVNASHAMESQGLITIKTWNGEGNINISISDTGSGIEEDKLSRIFEPFFTTKDVGKGTGLGLSIAYDIVKKHNGDISVDSTVGKGTTFNIVIPVSDRK